MMRRKANRGVAWFLVLGLCFGMIGCGQEGAETKDGRGAESKTETEIETGGESGAGADKTAGNAGGKKAEELTIAALISTENMWGSLLGQGFEDAAAERGVKVVSANYKSDQTVLIDYMNTYASQGVDGILYAPSDSSDTLANQLAADGIAIGAYNSFRDTLTGATIQVAYSNYDLGGALADTALELSEDKLGGEVHLGVISSKQGNSISEERDSGLVDKIVEHYPDAKIENQTWTTDATMAVQYATDMLTANKELNLIYATNEGAVIGSVTAIRNLGLEGQVFVVGIDATEQICEMLKADDEILWCVSAQDSYHMAYTLMNCMIDSLTGEREVQYGEQMKLEIPTLKRGDTEAIEEYADMLRSRS